MSAEPRKFGWLPQLPDYRDYQLAALEEAPLTLPSVVDMRPQSVPIYDQDGIGSCTANAALAMFHFVDKKQGGSDEEPSRLFNYYESRRLGGLLPQDIGAYNRDAIKVCATLGSAREQDWPYIVGRFNQPPPQIAYENALDHQSLAYFAVAQSEEALKGCLAAGYPFMIGSTLYQNFYNASSNGLVPMPSGSIIGGHALMYVGYDDAMRRFIVQGSWGSWGDRGYIYMPYDYLTNGNLSADCWTIRQVEEGFVPPPPPDPNHYRFSAIVAIAKPGKLVLDVIGITLPSLKGRRIRINTGVLETTAKVKNNDETTLIVKGEFDMLLSLKGSTVSVETIE